MTQRSAWEAKVHSVLGNDVSIGPNGRSLLVPCGDACGKVLNVDTTKAMPPEAMRRKMEREGWRLGRKRSCPSCNAPKAQGENTMPIPADASPALPPAIVAVTPAQPTEAARAVRRAVLQWLDQSFEVASGQYVSGVTDATIAKETGSSVESVRKLREDFYGSLKEPTELAEVRVEIDAIRRESAAAREALDTKLSALAGRMLAAEQRLSRAAKAGGWA